MKRFTAHLPAIMVAASLCTAALGAHEAYAHGRVFVGGGVIVGQPYYAYPPYYGYPYYAYSPYGYSPYGYAPEPYSAAGYGYAPYQPPAPAPADQYYHDEQGEYCREYMHTVNIEGQRERAYGHACRQPDGKWKIID